MESVDPAYKDAKRQVKQLRDFYQHALTWVVVLGFLAALNLMTSPGRGWIQWIAFGWGLGLIAQGLSVFAFSGILGHVWEQRKTHEYLARHRTTSTHQMR